jgi:hypothetical protein
MEKHSTILHNTAFDNLVIIINSRETQRRSSCSFATFIMLPKANPHYISKLFEEFKLKIPKEIYSYIERK